MTPWEQTQKESEINRRDVAEGRLTETQGYRAGIGIHEKYGSQIAPTETNAENIRRQIGIGQMKFNDPAALAENIERVKAQQADFDLKRNAWETSGQTVLRDKELNGSSGQNRDKFAQAEVDARDAFIKSANSLDAIKKELTPEQTASARTMGLQLEEYAGGLTRSGGLASGADANSVAGYSQQVNAEYAMNQSLTQVALMGAIMNMMNLPQNIVDAITGNIGFQVRPWGPGL
jgi:hypothetical protein